MSILKNVSISLLACILALGLAVSFTSCGDDGSEPEPEKPGASAGPEDGPGEEDENPSGQLGSGFARGADVSWLTQQEAGGEKFYDASGAPADAMTILRDECGVNAVRLRVWVNPADGYCSPADVLAKALRAKALGLSVMVDFHLSDTWADPAKQTPPAAWAGAEPSAMAASVSAHVSEVLASLKTGGVDVRWVQIGNETPSGMLWESGRVKDRNAGSFPLYLNAGYDAVKAVYPDAKVIVHLDRGQDKALYQWFFDLITARGARFDMIGMSLYPETGTWPEQTDETAVDNCIENIALVARRYGKPVMLCEIGIHYTRGAEAARVIEKIVRATAIGASHLKGVFYWEPQASPGFNGGYNKGAFVDGRPNGALAPFTIL